jgi:hypothetical protein
VKEVYPGMTDPSRQASYEHAKRGLETEEKRQAQLEEEQRKAEQRSIEERGPERAGESRRCPTGRLRLLAMGRVRLRAVDLLVIAICVAVLIAHVLAPR